MQRYITGGRCFKSATDLLVVLCAEIVEFDCMEKLHHEDDDFKEPWEKCTMHQDVHSIFMSAFS